jgi:hypothetical protein
MRTNQRSRPYTVAFNSLQVLDSALDERSLASDEGCSFLLLTELSARSTSRVVMSVALYIIRVSTRLLPLAPVAPLRARHCRCTHLLALSVIFAADPERIFEHELAIVAVQRGERRRGEEGKRIAHR